MMKKKYLMKGFAALALVVGFASCVKDVEGLTPAQEDAKAKENAELQLGITIPDGQTWSMSTQVTANVTIDLNPSETYTVGICDKNPLNYEDAMFYALKTAEGGSMTATFTAPEGKEEYYGVACQHPAHFRYVGKEAAKYMTENNLCLEEFIMLYDESLVFLPKP